MKNKVILVLADPSEPQLAMLTKLPAHTTVIVGKTLEAFQNAASGATVILNWSGSLSLLRDLFRICPNLKWIHSRSVGLERSLFPELIASPLPLTNGSGVFSPSLAEFVVAGILYFAKDLRRMVRNQMAGVWQPFDITLVSGQTVGIVGYGDIGRAVASRVRALGMRVLAVRRHPRAGGTDPLVERIYGSRQRIKMLGQCDYVVVTAPLTAETQGMIGKAEFAAMKSTAVVINVGRGPVIHEEAMVAALSQGRIKGAALDVFDQEPLAAGHPFYKLDSVLLSPHCADHTSDWLDQAMLLFLAQFERFRRGKPLLNVVDKKLGY